MITKFKQSWELFKASIVVTFRYPKLLLFPVLTTFMTAFIALFFFSALALPVVFRDTGYHIYQPQHWVALKDYYSPQASAQPKVSHPAVGTYEVGSTSTVSSATRSAKANPPVIARGNPWFSIFLLPLYLVSMFLATFFNVAFYSEIIAALNGKGVSIRRGFGMAWSRLPAILAWSLLAGVVGWLIRAIEQRLPFMARVVTGFIGLAWSIASVFAIPVIIQQESTRNPINILQQSAAALKRTWGEGLIGYIGFSAASTVIFMCSLIPLLLLGGLALWLKSVWLGVIAAALWVLGLCLMAYISGVAGNVYRCALYLYAAEGVVPEPYNRDLLDMAWKVKKT
jgi:hypothetical protein